MQNYTKTITSSSSISVGMDVHKKTIAFCLDHAETGVVLDERELLHDLPKVINYLQKVQTRHGELSCGYEASSCGFRLQRTLQAKGISCEGIAPSSMPRRSGDRVKTDRRDAKKLATMYAAGVLTPIHIPDEAQEALRSLLRCRGDLSDTIPRMKQRILAFLQVRGFAYSKTRWTQKFHTWLRALPITGVDQNTLHTYLHQFTQLEQEVLRIERDLSEQIQQSP